MPEPIPPHDYLIHQWLHRERTRPYRLFISNAAYRYDPDVAPHYFPRERCPSCLMYATSCRPMDYRQGAQPGRLLIHNRHLYTGTFHRFFRYGDCGNLMAQFGYGPCRSKESQGQIAMGNMALLQAVRPGVHSERLVMGDEFDNVFVTDTLTYGALNYALWLGRCNPGGAPPEDHYDLCLRFAINLPADAVITGAELYLRRAIAQSDVCHVEALLLDRDSMGLFSTTPDDPDNPCRANPNGPARLNCHGGADNKFAIELENGGGGAGTWLTNPSEIMRPIVEAFIARPGYSPGNHLGIVLQSNQALNLTLDNAIACDGYTSSGFGAILRIRWREAGVDPDAPAASPPRLMAYQHMMQESSPVPPDGTWPGAEPDPIDPGERLNQAGAQKIPDLPWAGAYRHCFLIPVDRLEDWWSEATHGPAPYPADAHNKFPLNDCQTYEIPCFPRTSPFRYRSLGSQMFPNVARGLRGIVSFSSDPAQHGFLPVYAGGGQCGTPNYTGMDENTWRLYRGQTHSKRYVWQTDPLQRGWFVEYTAYKKAWYAQDADFEWFCNEYANIGDPDSCMFRWNAWYHIEIRAHFHPRADLDDPDFRAWVLSHEAGFGGIVTPRHAHCNDVLRQCGAGLGKAMGDNIWPPQACQEVVSAQVGDEVKYPPCMHEDGAPSWWYLPDFVSKHVKSPLNEFIGAYPELGLYHETKFVRRLDPDGGQTETVYGWAILAFQTNMPWLLDADSGVEVKNEIQRFTIINPNGCEDPPVFGGFVVGWDDDPAFWSGEITPFTTAAQFAEALGYAANIGQGNVEVTGPAGGPWVVEYVNDLRGQNVPQPALKSCTIDDGAGCLFSVSIETIQNGTGASR